MSTKIAGKCSGLHSFYVNYKRKLDSLYRIPLAREGEVCYIISRKDDTNAVTPFKPYPVVIGCEENNEY